jgi:NAD-dependent dihydropyrimidine dehydrogenase PreA subunit
MRFSIFYFSGTGNTRWAVNELNNSINKLEHECKVYSIETEITNLQEIINASDIIGFAFPIYGADMPSIVHNFIDEIKDAINLTRKKQCFIITTAGYIDAFGPFAARKILKSRGLKLVGYINIKISNNISTPKIKAKFISSEMLKVRMNKGKDKIDKLAYSITNQRPHIRNIGFYLLPGVFIRKATKNGKKNNYKDLSVDKERCSQCMTCVNNCPTKSIIFSDREFTFLPSCTACMRCYNFCPQNAICNESKFADPSIYRRYRGPQTII